MPFYSLPLTKECSIFYSSAYINEDNKTANDILYGMVHRFYQAILYIENVVWFHGTHTHTHTRARAHKHTHTHTRMRALTYKHTHSHMHTHARTHSHSHTHVHALTYKHTHVRALTYTLTHAHSCAHTHTHTHTLTTHTHKEGAKKRIHILRKEKTVLKLLYSIYTNNKR